MKIFMFKIRNMFLPLLAALLLVGFTSCDDDDDTPIIDDEVGTIADEVEEDLDFTILADALEKSGLESELDGDNNYTLLAPPDEAFIDAGITNLDRFTAEELAAILRYHLIADEVYFNEFNEGALETQNGNIYLGIASNRFFINGDAQFLQINFQATNGVVHTIDEVLMPPERDIAGIVTNESDLSTLEEAVNKAGLADELADAGPYTLFAPTDQAFEQYFNTMEISGLEELSSAQLTDILKYHIVSSRMFSPDLEAGAQETLQGNTFRIIFDYNTIVRDNNDMTDDAVVSQFNLIATNGVVNKINRVLVPDNNQ